MKYWIFSIACSLAWTPNRAEACGGTFEDVGPRALPIPQTAENILFAMEEDATEVHIQIGYQPDAAGSGFAWIVPMTAVPEFAVGSQRLFDNVLAGTVPSYGFDYSYDDCGLADGSGEDGGPVDSGGGDDSGGPTVVLTQTVGAFEITVLQGGSAEEVTSWLADNGYRQDPAAEPILAEYLAEGYVFAAFKLAQGADVTQIHPITLRFATAEACVPLRLTRIAAVDDMEVRTFFLADERVVPQNYRHVVVNPLKLDWADFASNYREVVAAAVDSPMAEGKAFVTEYAGSSAVVAPDGIHSASWDAAAFVGLPAVDAIDTLAAQGLAQCDAVRGCELGQPLIEGLLHTFLPVPEGLDDAAFYGCLACNAGAIDEASWGDGSGFAAALDERIVQPGRHALDLLARFPTLTRMYTTISPAEMTADPLFWQNPDLPDVDLTDAVATRRVFCNDDALWTLPDGREVYVRSDGAWPSFDAQMPWEEKISETPSNGAAIVLVDNKAIIDTRLASYNCELGWPANLCSGGNAGDTGGPSSDTGGPGSGSSAGGGDESSSSGAAGLAEGENGCACASDPRGAGGSPFAIGCALLGLGRSRGRRRRPCRADAREPAVRTAKHSSARVLDRELARLVALWLPRTPL